MKNNKLETFKEFEGKTIKSIDISSMNVLIFTFTDNTTADVYAESGSASFAIPYFDIYTE